MAQSWRLVVMLACAFIPFAHSRKGVDAGGGAGGGGGSCEEVYITLYNSGENFKIPLDYGQNFDENTTMIRHQLNDHGCVSSGWTEPYFEYGSCNHSDKFDFCASYSKYWNCTVSGTTNWTAFRQNAFKFDTVAEVDDCSEEPRCMGAPNGTITCDYTPLPSAAVYPTGLNVEVFGDRCNACGLKEQYCPKYYDAHRCTVTWEYESAQPDGDTSFKILYTVSGAMPLAVSIRSLAATFLLAAFFTL